jgi:hypothetical protein
MSGSPTMDRPAQLVFVYDRTSELGHIHKTNVNYVTYTVMIEYNRDRM